MNTLPAGNIQIYQRRKHIRFKHRSEVSIPSLTFAQFNQSEPNQRQSLLEFALGNQTVQLKLQIDQLTKDIATQTGKKSQAERTLTGFAPPYTLAQYPNYEAHVGFVKLAYSF